VSVSPAPLGLELTWLGHSTVVLDVDGIRLLTDPLLRRHAGVLRRRTTPPDHADWRDPDAVLLSHLHHDHADLGSLSLVAAGTPVVTAAENVAWLQRHGLRGVTVPPGEWLEVAGSTVVGVSLCRAEHHSRPMPHRPNAATGHLVRSSAGPLWFAGDTSLFDDMEAIPEQAGAPIELAFVPISGWGPRLSGGHMGPAEAAQACARVGARRAVPVHWGTLHTPGGREIPRGWMHRPPQAFLAAMDRHAPDCEVLVPEVGIRVGIATAG
jgi:L-ascorbate metabolism protein UlaG (beta-lactamase superfamily)